MFYSSYRLLFTDLAEEDFRFRLQGDDGLTTSTAQPHHSKARSMLYEQDWKSG
jgi:hypothetical protein